MASLVFRMGMMFKPRREFNVERSVELVYLLKKSDFRTNIYLTKRNGKTSLIKYSKNFRQR